MRVRLTQIDGKLPNLALMRLSAWHKARGDEVWFTKSVTPSLFEPDQFDRVYGSAIFDFSADRLATFRRSFPDAVVGGTGSGSTQTVEDLTGDARDFYDYSIYPGFTGSIGYTQRGCRLKCKFCVVPGKEGAVRSVNGIDQIWRGPGYPKHLHLLDNDFFGQPGWREKIAAIRDGGFKVCFNQGINVRFIADESAAALASVKYYDDSFKTRRVYTAWDNIGDESRFFAGIEALRRHGIPPTHVMAYMLIGWDKRETWERVMHRLRRMQALGIRPYPMVHDAHRQKKLPLGGYNGRIEHRTLGEFQRWVIRKAYNFTPFEAYDVNAKGRRDRSVQIELIERAA